jgi:hypothetical protein
MISSHKAASATSEVTSLESTSSSYARIIRDDKAEPTTNVAENHSDVLQAAGLFVTRRGSPRDRDHAQEQEHWQA